MVMGDPRYRVVLDDFEQGIVINSLLELRNNLLGDDKPTEDINELILKIIDAPQERRRWQQVRDER